MKGHLVLKKNTVILSVNNDEGNLCLDIFIRENNTYGFEEYRKDPENVDGWYKVGNYSNKIYNYNRSKVIIQNAKVCLIDQKERFGR